MGFEPISAAVISAVASQAVNKGMQMVLPEDVPASPINDPEAAANARRQKIGDWLAQMQQQQMQSQQPLQQTTQLPDLQVLLSQLGG